MSDGVLIACIGNIFLGDDGAGCEVARELARSAPAPNVQVVDYGIRGFDLAYALLRDWDAVILVDAVSRGGEPGTLYQLEPTGDLSANVGLDPHSMDPVRVLANARALGDVTARIYIVGIEPLDFGDELEGRMGLSPQVQAAIPEAAKMAQELAERIALGQVAETVAG